MCQASAESETRRHFSTTTARTRSKRLVDHYITLFRFIKTVNPPNLPPPLVASTDGVRPSTASQSRKNAAALLAYLRKL